jgi:thymidylate synthase
MYTITADTIAPAHEAVVRLIMESADYNDVVTEDKELTFEASEPVNIHITRPNKPPFSSPALKFGSLSLDAYREQILHPRPLIDRPGLPDFSYLYSNLIFDYPSGDPYKVMNINKLVRVDWQFGNGRGDGINQINYIINKLKESPTSRRAVVSLFEPRGHPLQDDPPCMNHLQFMVRNNQLNCHVLFRSNDMLSAWGGNAYGLAGLQEYVADKLNVEVGWLETTSTSAHIYFARDNHELQEFRRRWH